MIRRRERLRELREPDGVGAESRGADRDVALRAARLHVEGLGGLQPLAARRREPEHRLAERHQIRHADHPTGAVSARSIRSPQSLRSLRSLRCAYRSVGEGIQKGPAIGGGVALIAPLTLTAPPTPAPPPRTGAAQRGNGLVAGGGQVDAVDDRDREPAREQGRPGVDRDVPASPRLATHLLAERDPVVREVPRERERDPGREQGGSTAPRRYPASAIPITPIPAAHEEDPGRLSERPARRPTVATPTSAPPVGAARNADSAAIAPATTGSRRPRASAGGRRRARGRRPHRATRRRRLSPPVDSPRPPPGGPRDRDGEGPVSPLGRADPRPAQFAEPFAALERDQPRSRRVAGGHVGREDGDEVTVGVDPARASDAAESSRGGVKRAPARRPEAAGGTAGTTATGRTPSTGVGASAGSVASVSRAPAGGVRRAGSRREPAVARTQRRDPDPVPAVEQRGERLSGGLDARLHGGVGVGLARGVRRLAGVDQEHDGRGALLAEFERRQLARPRPPVPVDPLDGVAAAVLAGGVELDAGAAHVGGYATVIFRRQPSQGRSPPAESSGVQTIRVGAASSVVRS